MKTYAQIKSDLAEELNDSTTATATLVASLINRLYRKLKNRICRIRRNYYLKSVTVTVTPNTAEYSFEDDWSITDFKEFVMIKDENGNRIYKGDLRRRTDGYYLIGHQKLGFVNAPSASATYTLCYIYEPDNLSEDADKPVLPEGWQDIFIPGVSWLFYRIKKKKQPAGEYRNQFIDELEDLISMFSENESQEIEEVGRTDEELAEELSDQII